MFSSFSQDIGKKSLNIWYGLRSHYPSKILAKDFLDYWSRIKRPLFCVWLSWWKIFWITVGCLNPFITMERFYKMATVGICLLRITKSWVVHIFSKRLKIYIRISLNWMQTFHPEQKPLRCCPRPWIESLKMMSPGFLPICWCLGETFVWCKWWLKPWGWMLF